MYKYIPVIGLEIHVELKTKSKMFCQCSSDYFQSKPNTHVCPVCLGLPGALPVPNKKAVEWTILIGKALNCSINKISKFDRKHYFYPDLPKGYQISQYDEPIAINGNLVIARSKIASDATKQSQKVIGIATSRWPNTIGTRNDNNTYRIHRVHLEEDTGKLIHAGDDTLIDFNRSGVPLVEIVTEPDFDNADDVKAFLEELQVIIRYLGVSDADMEKGTMRLEPNISIKNMSLRAIVPRSGRVKRRSNLKFNGIATPRWLHTIGARNDNFDELPKYKVEVKNINSFRYVKQAIEYEIKRQIELLEKGETPKQETRGFDEKKQKTYSQRSKEQAHDYRYFPEPDIPSMTFTNSYLTDIEKQLPELPSEKVDRYVKEFGIKYQDAFIITRDPLLAKYYEHVNLKFKMQNSKLQFKIKNFEQIIANLIVNKKLSTELPIEEFVKKVNELLVPKETDEKLLQTVIEKVLQANSKVVEEYKNGKENAIMFLVGQVMREMKGKADAKVVIDKLKSKLT